MEERWRPLAAAPGRRRRALATQDPFNRLVFPRNGAVSGDAEHPTSLTGGYGTRYWKLRLIAQLITASASSGLLSLSLN